MEPESGRDLAARKVEYLKFIFEPGKTTRTSNIASAFSVGPLTITRTLAKLSGGGYILHTPYRGITLTESGRHNAAFFIRIYRILSPMLVRNGLTLDEACDEVRKFESIVSESAVDRIYQFVGHPLQGSAGRLHMTMKRSPCTRKTGLHKIAAMAGKDTQLKLVSYQIQHIKS